MDADRIFAELQGGRIRRIRRNWSGMSISKGSIASQIELTCPVQPLSLLLKLNPRVSELALYDIRLAPGVTR